MWNDEGSVTSPPTIVTMRPSGELRMGAWTSLSNNLSKTNNTTPHDEPRVNIEKQEALELNLKRHHRSTVDLTVVNDIRSNV